MAAVLAVEEQNSVSVAQKDGVAAAPGEKINRLISLAVILFKGKRGGEVTGFQ